MLLYRPDIANGSATADLDWYLIAIVAAAVVQAIPLPAAVLDVISPQARPAVAAMSLVPPEGAQPISIDLEDSAAAILRCIAALAIFVAARQIFSEGGIRTVVRFVALSGLVLAAIALAQHATSKGLMYWTWKPLDEAAYPFGPFVNRNHFGTWAVLAVPLCIGYLTAHAAAHRGPRPDAPWQQRLLASLDLRSALLLGAGTLLILAIVVSLSRSSMVSLAAALAAGGLLARHRLTEGTIGSARPAMLVGLLGVCSALAVWFGVDPAAVTSRFSATSVAAADRLLIWRDTMGILQDFWLTGTGVGTFQTSMGVYQRTSPGVSYNQAHNHYLQVLAEGGLLVSIPVVLALVAFVRRSVQRLVSDRSGMYWVRTGAAAGLSGVAVQSLWETGLTTPANAALAAVSAAIVLHTPVRTGPGRPH